MDLLQTTVTGPVVEKMTFLAALIIAVVWLWKEISNLNKKRDDDLKLWRDTYQTVMQKMMEIEVKSAEVISKNTEAFEQTTDVLKEVLKNIKEKNV